ncbi:two-component system, cell cycle sensor histidine kinase and response regulator CckA [Ruegeria halocynthiae]|uniref:histidine kinase n=1 Tax=Ruegeria halocynthiae TaxID=985054 RepID=A0A1H2T6V1_9RHOB|nr:PAS domain-containing sensor histidine kinase [Ruegeria halocynthiae]SDW39611.1 two-component system, cell cycle sensor histidine kinase and response regulator CckA [Ruegeria halocynthiae]
MSSVSEVFPYRPGRWGIDRGRYVSLALIAVLLSSLPILGVLPPQLNAGVSAVGLSFLVVVAVALLRARIATLIQAQTYAALSTFLEQEPDACVITDIAGEIQLVNSHAKARLVKNTGTRLDECLGSVFANPSAVLLRLQSLAQVTGTAEEDIVTRGQSVPVSVSKISNDRFCWRFRLGAPRLWRNVQLPVVTVGRNEIVLDANEAAIELFGQIPTVLNQIPQADNEESKNIIRVGATDAERAYEISTLRHSGIARELLLTPVCEAEVTEQRASFADLPVPIMRLSPHGEIWEANRLAKELVGEIQPGTSNIEEMMQGLGYPIRDWLTHAAEQGSASRSEILRLARKDKEVFVQVTLSRIFSDGQVCLIAVLNDATELKTLEAQFVQGQKMQAVGQLAGGVAHDFNNLLTAISGHCDLLLLRHDQNDPNYGDLVQINQNANRAAALVSQLLAFSRKQTLRPEVLDLRDTISDLIHLLNRLVGEKVRLTLSHDPVLKPVCADKRQLEQVLMNLVVNARDAMPEGGEIRIETEVVTLDRPISRDRATVQPGEYVTVKVIDSGVGIPADKLQKVFEPFYTTKRTGEGTGLGLSTVYGIVKQTGGFIFVDSIQGKGTEFTVLLPVSAAVETPKPVAPAAIDEQSSGQGEGVVLLVEDEAPVRAFATRALRLKGYTVLEAESAEDALQLLDDPVLSVDVFVTDVVMPGMDGPTWVREAMKTRPDVRVVFMSGYTEGAFGEAGPEIENSTFLPKPFSLTQLTEAVFQQLN